MAELERLGARERHVGKRGSQRFDIDAETRGARRVCDSMYAETIDGYSRAPITCSVVRSDPAFTTEAPESALVSCSLRNPSIRAHSATYGEGAYCACSATSFSTALTTDTAAAFDEQLARQQRAVQLADGERPHITTAALSRSGGGDSNSAGQPVEQHAVGDQPLPRIRAAREKPERRADGRRRVVERAAQRQLVVVQAVGVEGRAARRGATRRT